MLKLLIVYAGVFFVCFCVVKTFILVLDFNKKLDDLKKELYQDKQPFGCRCESSPVITECDDEKEKTIDFIKKNNIVKSYKKKKRK